MVNPNKYIRTAYKTAFAALTVPTWNKVVPKSTDPIPADYVLLQAQSKNVTERSKDGFEWMCTIVFDIVSHQEAGYADSSIVDDIEGDIISIVESDVEIEGFTVKNINLVDSLDLDSQDDDGAIIRRVLTYQFWLNSVD